MKLQTRLFGEISYSENEVVYFPQGLPSFEEDRHFLLLPIEGSDGELLCLQGVDTPTLSFILMNPFSLMSSYQPQLQQKDRSLLQVKSDHDLCFFVLCAMRRPIGESTLNFKCPIAYNPDEHLACQVILESDDYHMHHSLKEFSAEGEGKC